MGLMVGVAYLLSRSSSNHRLLLSLFQRAEEGAGEEAGALDPLPGALKEAVRQRLQHDALCALLFGLLAFGIHASTAFTGSPKPWLRSSSCPGWTPFPALEAHLSPALAFVAISLGVHNHYAIPQLRKQTPWLLVAQPILRVRHSIVIPWAS